jgi:hypothetical protein
MDVRTDTKWGPVSWDGTLDGMQACLDQLRSASVPGTANLTIGRTSYSGPQITAVVRASADETTV